MATLEQFKFEWVALNAALNKIVTAVNRNSPLAGEGISLDEHGEQGVSINQSANKQHADSTRGGQQAGSQNLVPINQVTLRQVKWQEVTVVDPATCAQSKLSVLIYTGNASDSIVLALAEALAAFPQQ